MPETWYSKVPQKKTRLSLHASTEGSDFDVASGLVSANALVYTVSNSAKSVSRSVRLLVNSFDYVTERKRANKLKKLKLNSC